MQRIDSLTGLFRTPVEVEVWVNDRPESSILTISKQEESFSIPTHGRPQLVIFDKGSRILKKVSFQKPVGEWVYQLEHARDGVDRLLAIDELEGYTDSSLVLNALQKALLDDPFTEVRRSVAWAIGDVKKTDVSGNLIAAYGDRDAKVRDASVTSLGHWRGEKVISTLRHAFEKDSSYSVTASALRSLAKVDSLHRNVYCQEGLKLSSRNEVIRTTALQLLSETGDDSAFGIVKAYTRYGVDRSIRIPALNALAAGWKKRDEVVNYIIGLLADPSFHVRRAVINILGGLGNSRAIEPLQACAAKEPDSRLAKEAREAAAKISESQGQKAH